MVQFRGVSEHMGDYWKLQQHDSASLRRMLHSQHGLKWKSNGRPKTDKDRLAYLGTRLDRGLLLYDKCKPSELKQFCKARKVHCAHPFHQHKMAYMRRLETLDEDGPFDRLLSLPPELRLLIHEQHIEYLRVSANSAGCSESSESGDEAYYFFAVPPFAQVSRLVRNEVLPLLYTSFRFRIDLHQFVFSHQQLPSDERKSWSSSIQIQHNTIALFRHIHLLEFVTRIRLRADWDGCEEIGLSHGVFDSWDIDFTPGPRARLQRRTSFNDFASRHQADDEVQERAWNDIARRMGNIFTDAENLYGGDDYALLKLYARALARLYDTRLIWVQQPEFFMQSQWFE
ncbi:hypothetical protein DOTSEDRAFT_74466 [Dothistroma septosporum NZE10]|uniref:Uncharacterized protein n=1 Tax=Dothistroma septosporum (strain NZE10 / CBS 128990) TaxID=675120 RepID=N1PHX2_DOTSN|nr:hypothetical protein DOTSEDRAFT_74466 [Dothistroma septosporum NZE10]